MLAGHSSQSNQTSGVVSPSAKIPARPISQTAKNVPATIAAPAATNKSVGGASGNKTGGKGGVGRNRKKGVGSSLRVPQKSPGTECVPHPVYYGVWEHTITGAFQAQVSDERLAMPCYCAPRAKYCNRFAYMERLSNWARRFSLHIKLQGMILAALKGDYVITNGFAQGRR